MALVLSILLLTSAVAPALAVDTGSSSQYQSVETTEADHRPDTSERSAALPAISAATNESTVLNRSTENRSIPENATTEKVTLVTGQTVTVVETENRTQYRVSADAKMHKVSTPNATYVFPADVDFGTFDRNLFNVDFLVKQNLTDAESDSIPVIVSEAEREGYTAFDSESASALASVAGTEQQATLESIDAAAGTVSKSDASAAYRDLAAADSVGQVSLDVKYEVELAQTEDAVSAPEARRKYDVSGNNVKIAVIDSGINESHPAIDREVVEKDFTGEGITTDFLGHGTHVAGIIASDNETYTGMAPNASLMDLRVFGFDGSGSTSDIIDAMEYATAHDADIISMSLGGPSFSNSNDPYKEAVNAATANGTLVVVAAGNYGKSGYGTVGSPGTQSGALTVGASNASSGEVAVFSSRGPTEHAYNLKPNVVAPGVEVMSADNDGDGFVAKSGTSMATPAVSGIAALLLEKNSSLSPQQVKSIITTTADPLASETEGEYAQGTGEVNATDAVGSDIVISPGTVNFGTYAENTTVTRNISVTNRGDTERTFNLSASADQLGGNETANVALGRNSITVGANSTATVQLEVDTSTSRGFYSGRVSFDGGTYAAAFGFTRAHNVTIHKETAGNTSADGDFVWLFADQYSPFRTTRAAGITQIDGSSVTYPVVQGGEYHVFTHGVHEGTRTPVVMSDTLSVTNSTTHTLNESKTVAYNLDTSALESQSGSLDTRAVEVNYMTAAEFIDDLDIPYTAGFTTDADGTEVRFLPDQNLNATVERVLVQSGSAGGSDNFSGSDIYHLVHTTRGVDNGRMIAVDSADLAEKRMRYYRAKRSGSYDVSLAATGSGWEVFQQYFAEHDTNVTDGIGAQREQSIYVNPAVAQHAVQATSESDGADSWNLTNGFFGFTTDHSPGRVIYRNVNEHPYVSEVDLTVSFGYLYGYSGVAQRDQSFHVFEDEYNDTARLRLNGSVVSEVNTTEGGFNERVGEWLNPQTDVELSVIGRNGATSLSTRTITTKQFTYVPGEDYRPPSVEVVDVSRLTKNNTVGSTISVLLTADDDATDISAKLATDASGAPSESGTGNWQAMSVEKVDETWFTDVYRAEIDVNEAFGQHAGPVDIAVEATDADGNSVEKTTLDAVRVDAKKPTVSLTAAGSGETPTDAPATVRTNETLTVNLTTDGTPGETIFAGTLLSAEFTNFRWWDRATETGSNTWTARTNLSVLPDDGNYTLGTAAVDEFRNVNLTDSGVTVVLDRKKPDLGATIEKVGNNGKVTLTSDEPLRSGSIDASVENPNGSSEAVSLTRNRSAGEYVWDGTFALDSDGTYTVTASGADRTGNLRETTATTEIQTLNVTTRNVTVVLEKSGLFIEFRTNETGFNSTVSVTESRSALAPLSKNLAGLSFLNGELGKNLTKHLDDATIGIPVNESNLPPGIDAEQVKVSYYDESNGTWKLLDTTVEKRTVRNETRTYWVTNVTHFSTYGAVADDRQAPTVDSKTPTGSFGHNTTQRTVTFNYSDDISGVNASAVEFYFDGERVTDSNATNVTSAYATYNATGLSSGDYEATVTLEDEAGNAKNYTTSFTIEAKSTGGGGGGGNDGGSSGGGGGGGGAPPPAVQASVVELTGTYAKAEITNARKGEAGQVSFEGGLDGGEVTFRGLEIRPSTRDSQPRFLVEAESSASEPSGVPAFVSMDETLGYLTVTPTYIKDKKLETVGITFGVDAAKTDAPKNVALYHHADGEWSEVNTTFRQKKGGSYRFYAAADSTGTFAVGLDTAEFEVSDAALNASKVAPGDSVSVSATVENVGSGEGTHTVELTVGGEVVATKDVTLAAGESATVEFVRTFEAGDHEVAVGSATAGTLSVSEDASESDETDASDGETTQNEDGGSSGLGLPGFGLPATLVALLAALLFARRRE